MLPLLEPSAPCPGCGSSDLKPLHVLRNRKPIAQVPFLALVGCHACGLVFTSPRPSESELSAFYDRDVEAGWLKGRSVDDPAKSASLEKTLNHKRTKARRLLDALASLGVIPDAAAPHGFDLGCGLGAFLDVLQDRGWKTSGLEPAYLREFASRRHTIIDDIPQTSVFHLVNVNHVLEHVLLPWKTLEALARASVEGAVLLCSVPDLESLPRHRDLHYVTNRMHINTFTGASLAIALRRTGWRPVRVVTGTSLPEAAGDDAARLSAIAVRDARADSDPLPADPLSVAVDALRAYGRLLGPDGKGRTAGA